MYLEILPTRNPSVYYNNQTYVNDAINRERTKIENIKRTVCRGTQFDLIIIYFIFNSSFEEMVKLIKNLLMHNNFDFADLYQDFLSGAIILTQTFETTLLASGAHVTVTSLIAGCEEIVDHYYSALQFLFTVYGRRSTMQLEQFMRPLQDALKIHHERNNGLEITEVEPIPESIYHCEMNVKLQRQQYLGYVGVSKLCCPYCYTYLNIKNKDRVAKNNRGTHGICYPGECLLKDQYTAVYLQLMALPQRQVLQPYLLTRRLSNDNRERDIFFERNIRINGVEYQDLFQLKEHFKLNHKSTHCDL